ncbi:MAG: stalk domain-containing protein [Firmicutes bacterium]|nr:stalk domain-containing protein [Bacillota bacterium]
MKKHLAPAALIIVLFTIFAPVSAFTNYFVPRTEAPCEYNHHFTTGNPFYLVGLGMPNCTAYAWGRAYEILGHAPNLNIGNARYWFYNDGGHPNPYDNFQRGQEPRLGAIAVWGASDLNAFGHVAIVERIHEDGTVDISESFWGGERFMFTQNVDVRNLGAWRPEPECRNFLGFIYLCSVYTPPPERILQPEEPSQPSEELIMPDIILPPPIRIMHFVIGSRYFIDSGMPHVLEAAPFIENNRTMVPLRAISEALGAKNLSFNAGVITFDIHEQTFTMEVGQPLAGDMGIPIIVDGRTFVPLAYIINEMGAEARWDRDTRAVYIYIKQDI